MSSEVDASVLAAIEAHRAAYAEECAIVGATNNLAQVLPRELRRTHFTVSEKIIVETDDPRWIQAQIDYWPIAAEADKAACAILDLNPTTIAGVMTIINHAEEHRAAGAEWPDSVVDGDHGLHHDPLDYGERWEVFLLERTITKALQAIAAGGGNV